MTVDDITQVPDLTGWNICGNSSHYTPAPLITELFPQTTPVADWRAGQFLYLFRRFGFPIHGSDPYKHLASYFLTTADADVAVWCRLSASWTNAFGYALSPAYAPVVDNAMQDWHHTSHGRNCDTSPTALRITHALRGTLTSLKRPVPIRDTWYTITGPVCEDTQVLHEVAPVSSQAGYGIGCYDPVTGTLQEGTAQ